MKNDLLAFLSYSTADDNHESGYITRLRERLEGEFSFFLGRDCNIFQDRKHIQWGEAWRTRISEAIQSATFFIPVLTPRFFNSAECQQELREFILFERKLSRSDLILPIYYSDSPAFERSTDPTLNELRRRQFIDWRELRRIDLEDHRILTELRKMAERVRESVNAVAYTTKTIQTNNEKEILHDTPDVTKVRPTTASTQIDEEFILEFKKADNGGYWVCLLQSPTGQQEQEYISEEVARDEIDRFRLISPFHHSESSEEMGKRLFRILLPGAIGRRYYQSLAILRGKFLRIVIQLNFDEPRITELQSLPWEYTFLDDEQTSLGLSRKSQFVRSIENGLEVPFHPWTTPFRLLFVSLQPRGRVLLELYKELAIIKQSLGAKAEVEVLDNPSLQEFRRCLLTERFHAVHISGHSQFDENTGEGYAIFSMEDDFEQHVSGKALSAQLRDLGPIWFTVLNCADSGRLKPSKPFEGLGMALIRGGVPAVVALQSVPSDRGAILFSESFYQSLALGDTIEAAMSEGRLAIYRDNPQNLEWGGPVLYLQGKGRRALPKPTRTYGLSRVSLAVSSTDKSLHFYQSVLGLHAQLTERGIQVRAGGHADIMLNPRTSANLNTRFGFRFIDPADVYAAIERIQGSGGRLLGRGEIRPGLPYAHVADPDGHEMELWFE